MACAGIVIIVLGQVESFSMSDGTVKTLSPSALRGLERRKICPEIASKYGVHSGSCAAEGGEVRPDPNGNVIVFPFIDRGGISAEKYRAPGKKFWQRAGGKRTFWNADALDDPALIEGRNALVITEGEFDALSVLTCGYPFAVSVPDGAPAVPDGKSPEDLDPVDGNDDSGKFSFLWHNRDRLKKVKRFIIAADADGPGRRLAAELVRRLSPARCSFVEYPSDCKDLNDVLMIHGPETVTALINGAKPYPVRGLYALSDYPQLGDLETFAVGFDGWSRFLSVFPGEFMVISGVPSHGKSSWALNLIANLATIHGWKTAICSPEMRTVPMLRDRFRRYKLGRRFGPSDPDIPKADAWIQRSFVFIDTDPTGTGTDDESFDLPWIIDRATDAVLRYGVRVLLIDPWNEIEHARGKDENLTDYIARSIRELKRFARLYGVIVIVVAHPTKEVGKGGVARTVTLYDIEGSAAWFNKCDHGIVIERADHNSSQCTVYVQKSRFEEAGRKASLLMEFHQDAMRFVPIG